MALASARRRGSARADYWPGFVDAMATLLLVFIHVGGVVLESLIHRENLAASMMHGYKRTEEKGEA